MSSCIDAEHGIVCRIPNERLSYFGWPTVVRMNDGTLIVASSALRSEHLCPFGKTALNISRDNGKTWSKPRVIQDSPIDDRDAGICSWGDGNLLVTWFRHDSRKHHDDAQLPADEREDRDKIFSAWTDEMMESLLGSWVALSNDGGETWSEPICVPLTAPHGPVVQSNGDLLYLGKRYGQGWGQVKRSSSPILAARSSDGGRTWKELGSVPLYPGTAAENYYEPHVVELPDGKLIGMIRLQNYKNGTTLEDLGLVPFSMMQTESTDGGNTWTEPKPLNFHGSPPHLIRHSSGILVLIYGYRLKPFGQRLALSKNNGQSWEHDFILRDDGPDWDLGYPSTVELDDGSLFSVYYQKAAAGEKCSLLWSKWRLPEDFLITS